MKILLKQNGYRVKQQNLNVEKEEVATPRYAENIANNGTPRATNFYDLHVRRLK
jgi:hypothetical protein